MIAVVPATAEGAAMEGEEDVISDYAWVKQLFSFPRVNLFTDDTVKGWSPSFEGLECAEVQVEVACSGNIDYAETIVLQTSYQPIADVEYCLPDNTILFTSEFTNS
jgi:hypothetical protein